MKTALRVLVWSALLACMAWSFVAMGEAQPRPCVLTMQLSQSHLTLDIWKHVSDSVNKVDLDIPVACEFYDSVKVGDELLKNGFRTGKEEEDQ